MDDIVNFSKTPVPSYCHACGKPYPWTEASLRTLSQIIEEDMQTAKQEKDALEALIPDMLVESPRTQLANARLKHFLTACGSSTKDFMVSFLASVACEYIKKSGIL